MGICCTGRSILNQSSYHIKCYRKLGTSVNNLKRLIDKRKFQKFGSNNKATLRENKRLSCSVLPVYEKDKCMFYQLDENEKLHVLGTNKKLEETRDSELKQALQECPESLAVVRIRFERAFDSRAGDIAYHETCYVSGVTRHTPDYSQSPPSQTEVPELSNTLSALVTGLVTKVIEIKIKIGTLFEN